MSLWLLGLVVWVAGWVGAYFLGHSDGAHRQREAILNAQIAAQERIADATAKAPTDRASLADELRKHGLL